MVTAGDGGDEAEGRCALGGNAAICDEMEMVA